MEAEFFFTIIVIHSWASVCHDELVSASEKQFWKQSFAPAAELVSVKIETVFVMMKWCPFHFSTTQTRLLSVTMNKQRSVQIN